MKVGALDHPKTKGLKARLQCSRAQVIGHLELLWAFTAQHAPQGDVGKWGDEEIAEACDWNGRDEKGPSHFVQALTDKGFLDKSESHRLLVHDWPDHAARWVSAKLKHEGLQFIVVTTIEPTVEKTDGMTVVKATVPTLFSSLSKGSQGLPNQEDKALVNCVDRWPDFWKAYPKKVKRKGALKIWKSRKLDSLADTILADIQTRLAEDARWRKDGGAYIPDPTTYLNQDRWEDEITAPQQRKRA